MIDAGWNLTTAMALSNYAFRIDRRTTQYDVIGERSSRVIDMHQIEVIRDRTGNCPDNLMITTGGFTNMLSNSDYASFLDMEWLRSEFGKAWMNAADFDMNYLYVFAGYNDCMRMLEDYRQADWKKRFSAT